MTQDIECVFQGFGNLGKIYISNYQAASNIELLKSKKYKKNLELNIQAIISAAKSSILSHNCKQIPYYLYLQAEDHKDYDISVHFDKTYQFIENSRKKTNVLVHCYAGVSRSVSIVIAYLMKKYNQSFQNVYSLIRRKRKKINPNSGFVKQLQNYSKSDYPRKLFASTPKNSSFSSLMKSTSFKQNQNRTNRSYTPKHQTKKIFIFKDKYDSPQKDQAQKNRKNVQKKIQAFRQQFIKMGKVYQKKSELYNSEELKLKNLNSIVTKSAMLQRVKKICNKKNQQDLSTIPSNESQKQ